MNDKTYLRRRDGHTWSGIETSVEIGVEILTCNKTHSGFYVHY